MTPPYLETNITIMMCIFPEPLLTCMKLITVLPEIIWMVLGIYLPNYFAWKLTGRFEWTSQVRKNFQKCLISDC